MNDSVAVLIPYGGQCAHRARAVDWVVEQYNHDHPWWRVIIGKYHETPWIKARAIAAALAQTDADVLVLADADMYCTATGDAVAAVQHGGQSWACPYWWVDRLDEHATDVLLATGDAGPGRDEPPSHGQIGGGIVAVSRDVYEQCPLDPRFLGWGNEDGAWSLALGALHGLPWRGRARALHLWHPYAERQSRSKGSDANEALWARYQEWASSPPLMRRLVAEHTCAHL